MHSFVNLQFYQAHATALNILINAEYKIQIEFVCCSEVHLKPSSKPVAQRDLY